MHILVVHETEYLDKVVFEFQILPEILASRGHEVVVIDYPQHWKRHSWFDWGSLSTRHYDRVRKANKSLGITLLRPGILKIPIISRMIGVLTHFFVIGWQLSTKKYDVVLLYSVPTNGVSTMFWARINDVPVLFRLLDVLHEIVPHILLKYPTLLLESFVYTGVQRMSTTTPHLAVYAQKLAMRQQHPVYLDSGADGDIFAPRPKPRWLMQQLGLKSDDMVFIFAGTLYRFSGLDAVLSAMPDYIKLHPNTKLLIVGHGEQEQELDAQIKLLGLSQSAIMTGFVAYEHLGEYMNLADVGINPFEINAITNDIIPGKIYQYLASGISVIATPLAGMKDVFNPSESKKHGVYYAGSGAEVWDVVETARSHRGDGHVMPTLQETVTQVESMLLEMTNDTC